MKITCKIHTRGRQGMRLPADNRFLRRLNHGKTGNLKNTDKIVMAVHYRCRHPGPAKYARQNLYRYVFLRHGHCGPYLRVFGGNLCFRKIALISSKNARAKIKLKKPE